MLPIFSRRKACARRRKVLIDPVDFYGEAIARDYLGLRLQERGGPCANASMGSVAAALCRVRGSNRERILASGQTGLSGPRRAGRGGQTGGKGIYW